MPKSEKQSKEAAEKQVRKDPYEVLGLSRSSTDQEIKSAYRKMALKYHPDKNANDPEAAHMFTEITFSYNILSDPDKRRLFDTSGFEAVESNNQEVELDLSSLGTVNTMFAAIFSKLGVPIRTTVSASVLEEALNGMVTIRPLQLGQPVSGKVEKQGAHFYSVNVTEHEASSGLVCRAQSADKSNFKLLYFDQEGNSGLNLSLQEDCVKTGKVTSAGMYFLGFPTYHFDQPANSMAAARDPDAAFFKKLDGFQPCEITSLKAGTHVFAVYGDNFFKSVNYTIEVICAAPLQEEKDNLRAVEAQILSKRVDISKFETEYREVLAQFTEMTSRYAQEMQTIDELLKQRTAIQASYTAVPAMKRSGSKSKNKAAYKDEKEDGQVRDKKASMRETLKKKKKWYRNISMKVDKTKPC